MTQFGLPLPPPIGAQSARHNHTNDSNQPEPEAKASWFSRISHRPHPLLLTKFSIYEDAESRSANCPVCASRSIHHCGSSRKLECTDASCTRPLDEASQTGQLAIRLTNACTRLFGAERYYRIDFR